MCDYLEESEKEAGVLELREQHEVASFPPDGQHEHGAAHRRHHSLVGTSIVSCSSHPQPVHQMKHDNQGGLSQVSMWTDRFTDYRFCCRHSSTRAYHTHAHQHPNRRQWPLHQIRKTLFAASSVSTSQSTIASVTGTVLDPSHTYTRHHVAVEG